MNVDERAKVALRDGFRDIAEQYQLPGPFADNVLSAAKKATDLGQDGRPIWWAGRRDATHIPLVTLDPATSTDLDQAFAIEQDGNQLVLSYALADVGAFVSFDSPIETEAFRRGVTIYGLSEKIPLYPSVISQAAASLLPDGPRPAVLVTVAINSDGAIHLRNVERVVCLSRAKLAYENIKTQSLPYLDEFAQRMWADEARRGAIRVDFPKQEVVSDPLAPGGVRLELRARIHSEVVNSALSLAVNMAIGSLLYEAKTGLFRVMDDPETRAISRLRHSAHALGIDWDENETLRDLQRRLDPLNYVHQRFLLDARRAGGRAEYATYSNAKAPWHSAIGAIYSHATAPMRRLADRYVLDLTFQIANGQSPDPVLLDRISQMPRVMEWGESRAANVDRAVIDLLEAVSLQHRIGEVLDAEIVDVASGMVQTRDSAIRAKATQLPENVREGQWIRVRIESADPSTRRVRLVAVS